MSDGKRLADDNSEVKIEELDEVSGGLKDVIKQDSVGIKAPIKQG